MRGLMAMDLSARQAALLTKLIRDAAQIANDPGIQPIRPGDQSEAARPAAPDRPGASYTRAEDLISRTFWA